ncbi:glycosyltransferase family 4 protein [Thermogutta sp.]|uniref:glycosyltransferase family 4 protein n=1 Tax=Thermogutta sp. TaxID=1962930 RepID=UPI003C7977B6
MMLHQAKVLFAAHSAQPGGAEYCLDVLLRAIDRNIWDAEVFFACDGPLIDTPRSRGLPANIVAMSWWIGFEPSGWYWRNLVRCPWRIAGLVRKLRAEKFDLVYTNTAAIFESALAARLAGVPHVWHIHEMLTPSYWRSLVPLRHVRRCILRWSDAIIFESRAARRVCEEYWNKSFANCTTKGTADVYVVPNPLRMVPPPVTPEQRRLARELLGVSENEFAILWIGQFIPRKNPQLMLAAFHQTCFPGKSVLFMVGDGPLRLPLLHDVEKLEMTNKRVRLDGFRHNIDTYLLASDVLVLTSAEESFGLVLLEAAAFAVPVITTDCGGPSDIVAHAKTGFIVPRMDDAAIAKHLVTLAADNVLRRRMGEAARERVLNEFTPERYVAAVQEIMKKTMRRGR